jgi:ATP-dependent Clp protease adapter protein ClpS
MIVASSGENNSENYIVTILGEVLMAKKNRSTQLMSGIFLCQFLAK